MSVWFAAGNVPWRILHGLDSRGMRFRQVRRVVGVGLVEVDRPTNPRGRPQITHVTTKPSTPHLINKRSNNLSLFSAPLSPAPHNPDSSLRMLHVFTTVSRLHLNEIQIEKDSCWFVDKTKNRQRGIVREITGAGLVDDRVWKFRYKLYT